MNAALAPQSDPEVRRSGYGGTDITKILGISRFGSAWDVYLEKTGQSAPLVETPVMRWGKMLEEPIAREYSLQTGRKVRRVNQTVRHPKYPILMAHLDRTAHKKGERPRVLEAKTAGTFMAADFGEPGTDEVPPDYLCQVSHYLGVTGYDVADLAVLIGGQKFSIFSVPRDDDLIAIMQEETLKFHADHVLPRIPPDIDGSDAATEYLAARFKERGPPIEMTEEMKLLAFEYKGVLASLKAAEEQKKLYANQLRSMLGEASLAQGDGVTVRWSTVKEHTVSAFTVAEQRRLSVSIKDSP